MPLERHVSKPHRSLPSQQEWPFRPDRRAPMTGRATSRRPGGPLANSRSSKTRLRSGAGDGRDGGDGGEGSGSTPNGNSTPKSKGTVRGQDTPKRQRTPSRSGPSRKGSKNKSRVTPTRTKKGTPRGSKSDAAEGKEGPKAPPWGPNHPDLAGVKLTPRPKGANVGSDRLCHQCQSVKLEVAYCNKASTHRYCAGCSETWWAPPPPCLSPFFPISPSTPDATRWIRSWALTPVVPLALGFGR